MNVAVTEPLLSNQRESTLCRDRRNVVQAYHTSKRLGLPRVAQGYTVLVQYDYPSASDKTAVTLMQRKGGSL